MKRLFGLNFALLPLALILSSCAGRSGGAGSWFHIIFILIPIIAFGVFILKKCESINDSLFIIEGQLKRLSARLDSIDEKVVKPTTKKNK